VIPPAFAPVSRIDGVPGTTSQRPLDGQEYAIQGHTGVIGEDQSLAVATPDLYATDVEPDGTIRLTLLRSQSYTYNANMPAPPDRLTYPLSDLGEHIYELALLPMGAYSGDFVADEVHRQTEPIMMSETTRGMPPRHHEKQAEYRAHERRRR